MVKPPLEIFKLAIVSMHIPIVILLVLLSWRVFKSLNIKAFKYLSYAWAIQFLHVALSFLDKCNLIPLEFKNSAIFSSCIDSLDILSSSLLLFATLVGIREYRSLKEFISKYWNKASILLTTPLFLYFYYNSYSINSYYINVIAVPISLFSFYALFRLANYFKKVFSGFDERNLLYYGTLFYGILQLSLILNLKHYENQIAVLGYSFSLAFKGLILFGLQTVLLGFAKKQADSDSANKELNRILGRTFHEITGPLRTIQNRLRKLISGEIISYKLTRSTRKELSIIESNYNRLLAVVGASFKMYEDGFGRPNFDNGFLIAPVNNELSPNNINTLTEIAIVTIKDILREYEEDAEESISFTRVYGGECNIICYSYEIVQVIFNIIKNSYDSFTNGRGSVFIRTKVHHSFLDPDEFERIKFIKIEIADNGSGIDAIFLDQVVEEGFSTKKSKGRGFGLSIVKEFVEKNQGNFQIESPYDFTKFNTNFTSGTLVTLSFPLINTSRSK